MTWQKKNDEVAVISISLSLSLFISSTFPAPTKVNSIKNRRSFCFHIYSCILVNPIYGNYFGMWITHLRHFPSLMRLKALLISSNGRLCVMNSSIWISCGNELSSQHIMFSSLTKHKHISLVLAGLWNVIEDL